LICPDFSIQLIFFRIELLLLRLGNVAAIGRGVGLLLLSNRLLLLLERPVVAAKLAPVGVEPAADPVVAVKHFGAPWMLLLELRPGRRPWSARISLWSSWPRAPL
jgi:hypothetical protein